jgi:phosphotransferase system enzyme I (PtsI)
VSNGRNDAGTIIVEGIGAAPGRALGTLHRLDIDVPVAEHRTIAPEDVEAEVRRFEEARRAARERLEALAAETGDRFGLYEGRMFEAQVLMIDDPVIVEGTQAYIRENFLAAERAFDLQMLEQRVRRLDSGQSMLIDRLSDLHDIRLSVLSALLDLPETGLPADSAEPLILVARDLPPSVAARLDAARFVGFVTERGSRAGHSVLIARSLGIPAVVGIGSALGSLAHGERALVDGRTGTVVVGPSEQEVASYRRGRARTAERRKTLAEQPNDRPTRTVDDVDVVMQANVDRPDEVARAKALGAAGVGLLRSEFLVIGHREIPSEAEQYEAYRAALEAFPDGEVVLRTFDIGGDKFPIFLEMPREENPYLGWRAIRVCLDLPDLFLNQLRAAVRAAVHGNLKILLPFVTSVDEIERTRTLIDRVYAELGDAAPTRRVPVGIMVETPAAVELLDRMAPHVDFVSLGTNDLTQYVLAVDRGNAKLAGMFEPLHPALLAQYRRVVRACRAHDLPAGVCGELAGEPAGLAVLLGLGFTQFSISLSTLAEQREVARCVSVAELTELVDAADWADGRACRVEVTDYLVGRGALDKETARLSGE